MAGGGIQTLAKAETQVKGRATRCIGTHSYSLERSSRAQDHLLDQLASDAAKATITSDIQMTRTGCRGIRGVRVNVDSAYTDQPSVHICAQEGFAWSGKPIGTCAPLVEQSAKEAIAIPLAFQYKA